MSDKTPEEQRRELAESDPYLPEVCLGTRPLYGVPGVLVSVHDASVHPYEFVFYGRLSPDQARGFARSLELMVRLQREEDPSLRLSTIVGRERALLDSLATALNEVVGGPTPSNRTMKQLRLHSAGATWETPRGFAFEVQVVGPERDVTGHVVRVTVELDRFEAP